MLTPVAEGVWIDAAPVTILGMPLTSTMTALRVGSGVLLHSPVAMTDERRAAVAKIGPVTDLYAPNLFHHLRIGEWAAAFPEARVHGPAGLARKRQDLRLDRAHGSGEIAEEIEEVPIEGFRLHESALLYRPAGALVVADLVHNIGRPPGLWTQAYTRLMGFYGRVAMSRMIRSTATSDRAAFRRSLERTMGLPFERLIVGHGAPVETGAKESLAAAFGLRDGR